MRISLNWLKQYIKCDLNSEEIASILTQTGLEVEGHEMVQSIPGGLKGLVVGEVISAEKHPDADRLKVTQVKIDSNGGDPLQIVCGAPNVATGQKVIVATVGTTIHPTSGDPFKIKKAKIRGVESQGMICAEDEIGLGNDHDGIMILEGETTLGTPASSLFEVYEDEMLEIGLTPNRSDATGHIGVARDLNAALQILHQKEDTLRIPHVDEFEEGATKAMIDVRIKNPELCRRYSGLCLSNLEIKPSPDWLQNQLKVIGIRPKNNVVDITNYVLHETGQALHAFDLDKVSGNEIIVTTLPAQTSFETLDEKEVNLDAQDLMICDGNEKGLCIAGVIGGSNSGVTESTTQIFLESAHFDAVNTRKTSQRHLFFTDAAKSFEKGSDPNNTVYALKRAALLLKEYAGAKIESEIIDVYPNQVDPEQIELKTSTLNSKLGTALNNDEVAEILAALKMDIVNSDDEGFTVGVPTYRVDVTREIDLIEEVLRIYGMNRVPLPEQAKGSLVHKVEATSFERRSSLATVLMGIGFSEIMGLSLSNGAYYSDFNDVVAVSQSSNQGMDTLRRHAIFTCLESAQHNVNRQNQDLHFFEFGKTYSAADGSYREKEYLSLFISGQTTPIGWKGKTKQVDLYYLKGIVNQLLQHIGINKWHEAELIPQGEKPYLSYGLAYYAHAKATTPLIKFGAVSKSLCKQFDLKQATFFAFFDWAEILTQAQKSKVTFKSFSKFPAVNRDLSVVLQKNITFSKIEKIAFEVGKPLLKKVNLFDVYENEDQLGKDKKSYSVSFQFQDETKTLEEKEIESIMSNLISTLENKLEAVIRR